MRLPAPCAALALALLAHAAAAGAQVTATLIGVSDYRFRGLSLSQGKPAVQFSLVLDHPGGWYGGGFASTARLGNDAPATVQAVGFAGFVTPIGGDFHWDSGASYAAFSDSRAYDYADFYTGVASRRANARLHYSPDYFGLGRGSFYGEINLTHPVGDRLALLGHVGILAPRGGGGRPETARNPVDASAGLAFDAQCCNLQVAWVGTSGSGAYYPVYGTTRRHALVLSVSRSF